MVQRALFSYLVRGDGCVVNPSPKISSSMKFTDQRPLQGKFIKPSWQRCQSTLFVKKYLQCNFQLDAYHVKKRMLSREAGSVNCDWRFKMAGASDFKPVGTKIKKKKRKKEGGTLEGISVKFRLGGQLSPYRERLLKLFLFSTRNVIRDCGFFTLRQKLVYPSQVNFLFLFSLKTSSGIKRKHLLETG